MNHDVTEGSRSLEIFFHFAGKSISISAYELFFFHEAEENCDPDTTYTTGTLQSYYFHQQAGNHIIKHP